MSFVTVDVNLGHSVQQLEEACSWNLGFGIVRGVGGGSAQGCAACDDGRNDPAQDETSVHFPQRKEEFRAFQCRTPIREHKTVETSFVSSYCDISKWMNSMNVKLVLQVGTDVCFGSGMFWGFLATAPALKSCAAPQLTHSSHWDGFSVFFFLFSKGLSIGLYFGRVIPVHSVWKWTDGVSSFLCSHKSSLLCFGAMLRLSRHCVARPDSALTHSTIC